MKNRLAVGGVLGALLLAGATTTATATGQPASRTLSSAGETAPVVDVVDGDTIKATVNGRTETIRLIGLDTPETKDPRGPVQCYGPEATARAHQLLDGKTVKVEQDSTQGQRDVYGRLLAYVWLPDDRMFEEVMISEGFGREYTYDRPYRYQPQLKAAQENAQSSVQGLWAAATCAGAIVRPAPTPPPTPNPTPTPASAPAVSAAPAAPAAPPPSQPATGGPGYYKNCSAARDAGAAPLHRGDPGYRPQLDRDSDGVACE
jgi:micrococcal nuclease